MTLMKRFLQRKAREMGDETPLSPSSRQFALNFKRLKEMGFVTPLNRRSRIGEEMRLIKRRLMQRMILADEGERLGEGAVRNNDHVVLVTSARPNEGKSFIALNLALSIAADEGLNVLLIDADVARPSLRQLLKIGAGEGLTDLLRNPQLDLADLLYREMNHPITFLSSGTSVASATDLFAGSRMRNFINDSAMRYHDRIIIFDAPPLLASTEPVALAQHVGQIVFVVDSQETSRSAVESALELLDRHDNVNFVLNRTSSHQVEQFAAYYESYNMMPPRER